MSDDEVVETVKALWAIQLGEATELDRIHDYVDGKRGYPVLPDEADAEVKDIARKSVHNVLSLVRDTFVQNLAVVGYRPAMSHDNARPWQIWQDNRMDARQREVHRPAVTYGAAYCVVKRDDRGRVRLMPRSPRQLVAVYGDPRLDHWPRFAMDTWVRSEGGKRFRMAELFDATHSYLVELGEIDTMVEQVARQVESASGLQVQEVHDPVAHGAVIDGEGVCPVVRFVNDPDSEDVIIGEVAGLIDEQEAINEVNFERMIVGRFGAFPQKVISGWSGSRGEVMQASARRVWAFDDPEVKAQAFPAAQLQPYTDMLTQMIEHVAVTAQISPASVTGKMVNVSAEALAAGEANEQRKLGAKKDSFGESWEQVLRLAAALDGEAAAEDDVEAEVIWRDTEARTFSQVVDGLSKLTQGDQALPILPLLSLIPGLTQLQRVELEQEFRRSKNTALLSGLTAAAGTAKSDPVVADIASRRTETAEAPAGVPASSSSTDMDASELKVRFEALGMAVRATVDPHDAARRLGLGGIEFTGAVPVSVRMPEDKAADLEDK